MRRRIIGITIPLLALTLFLLRSSSTPLNAGGVREPAVAGQFYPASGKALSAMIRTLLAEIPSSGKNPNPVALISPHAGYLYSGETAAYGYQRLKGAPFHRVILLAPSHYTAFHGLSIPEVDAYETPLGNVPLDQSICMVLKGNPLVSSYPAAHKREHSLEVQLPFLQSVLTDFRIVPILVGRLDDTDYPALAKIIRAQMDDSTLLVASSDLTHYGPRFDYLPFRKDLKKNLSRLDHEAIREILKINRLGFLDFQNRTGDTICGFRPIALLLEILSDEGIRKGTLLHYTTSGDITGDFSNSVSYASILFYRRAQDMYLTHDEKKTLLRLAREAMTFYVREQTEMTNAPEGAELTDRLKEPAGAFVTLLEHKELRGCIGYIEQVRPLYQSVMENAVSACARDYRFPPVKAAELNRIDIEISVLTPKEEIPDPQDFIPGKQGIIIEKRGRRAVFLPQVATEQGWGREKTLEHLCLKAGLRRDDWKKDARLWVFTAEVFGEGKE